MELYLIVPEPSISAARTARGQWWACLNCSRLLGLALIFSSFVLFLITIQILQPERCCFFFFSKPLRHKNIAVK